jgi:hypothetical protein
VEKELKECVMKKKRDMIEEDDLAIYEPVNSEFRENMFMKWRAEEKSHDECGLQCKSRNKKLAIRKRVPLLQP